MPFAGHCTLVSLSDRDDAFLSQIPIVAALESCSRTTLSSYRHQEEGGYRGRAHSSKPLPAPNIACLTRVFHPWHKGNDSYALVRATFLVDESIPFLEQ